MTTVLDKRVDPMAEPGVVTERHDVEAVNRKVDRELYARRQTIYPKRARGTFRRLKWIIMAATLAIYYVLPWVRWNRGADLPNQAVLLDMANNRFFFFFLEIWPQEFYYVTGLLILGALLLFLATSVAGRVWCGYACPQTVWTDMMISVERFWQGDRNARILLDKLPWGPGKIARKLMTHLTWLFIGISTGGALVFYFRDAPTLARELATGTAPPAAYLFLGIFALTTYVLGGLAREQVCTYMCPWPRIQAAMTDKHTLLVSYREERGEPRGPARKGVGGVIDWSSRGDCIDCKACVVVCPAGIDIRDGSQLECIQCALCIDACNDIMTKIGRPNNLISYDTVAAREAKAKGVHEAIQLVRPRTLLYAGLLSLVGAIMLVAWLNRTVLEVNVLHDRNPPYVQLSNGAIRNGFTVKILNKLHQPRTFQIETRGIEAGEIVIVGAPSGSQSVTVETDNLRELRVFVTLRPDSVGKQASSSTPFDIVVIDSANKASAIRRTLFQLPAAAARTAP
ncbi:MAG: cytochrome c oxidase accessory protein CcoG [Hyphomicrobiaceae bacterium]